jgi:hypothetical protein
VRAREEGLKNVVKITKKAQATMVISILKSLNQSNECFEVEWWE